MTPFEQQAANEFVNLKAVSIQTGNPFTWGNGWRAPIYLDDRKILSYPATRNFFRRKMAQLVAEYFPEAEIIAGIATNAIAHGILVADQLALPFVSVYPYPKNHGMENQIEGNLRLSQNVVIIENQVNMGEHILRAVEALRNSGCSVLGAITLFDYDFPVARESLTDVDVKLIALTNFPALIQQLQSTNQYSSEVIDVLNTWHADPLNWNQECQK
ncbi:MAG: orotate phosphoribosyltransferase [Paludibacteraceae bacterium]|nr:orotate phosphoribosyltransferase [Paludibacteraceae bacterium]